MTSNSAAIRTAVQAAIGFIAGGFLTESWNVILDNHQIDATTQGLITIFLTFIVTKVQNLQEDKGKSFPVVTNLKSM